MSLKALYKPKQKQNTISVLLDEVQANVVNTRMVGTNVAAMAISTEDSSIDTAELARTAQDLSSAIKDIVVTMEHDGLISSPTSAQLNAGYLAGLVGGDPMGFMSRTLDNLPTANDNTSVFDSTEAGDSRATYQTSMEAFDNRENKNAMLFSLVYNLTSTRQNDFGEALFPTVTISPDEAGLLIEVVVYNLYKDIQRSTAGTPDESNFGITNIIRGYRDATILRSDLTKAIPVNRTAAAANFLLPTTITWNEDVGRATPTPTGVIKVGQRFSMIAISQTDDLVAKGLMDATDSLSPDIRLVNLYVNINNGNPTTPVIEHIMLPVEGLATSNFTYSTQSQARGMTLSFTTDYIVLDNTTSQWDGVASALLGALTAGVSARFRVTMTGQSNLEFGDTVVYGNEFTLLEVLDANGSMLLAGNADYDLINTLVTSGSGIEGYTYSAYRANANLRDQGQLVKVDRYNYIYALHVQAPITTLRPIGVGKDQNSVTLDCLVADTHLRTSNHAVTELIATSDRLRATLATGAATPLDIAPGARLVKPYFRADTVNMLNTVDSENSRNLGKNINGALFNKIRDNIYQMYSDSEYSVASLVYNGNSAVRPTAVIATSVAIGKYLTLNSTSKMLGGDFDVKVVSTVDSRMDGKIFLTFGVFTGDRNSQPNPLNFGVMAWAPEVVVDLQVSMGGQVSNRVSVSPRFRHINCLPVLTEMTITNLSQVTGKITQNRHTV